MDTTCTEGHTVPSSGENIPHSNSWSLTPLELEPNDVTPITNAALMWIAQQGSAALVWQNRTQMDTNLASRLREISYVIEALHGRPHQYSPRNMNVTTLEKSPRSRVRSSGCTTMIRQSCPCSARRNINKTRRICTKRARRASQRQSQWNYCRVRIGGRVRIRWITWHSSCSCW